MVRTVLMKDTEATPVQQFTDMPTLAEVMVAGADTGGVGVQSDEVGGAINAIASIFAHADSTFSADASATATTDGDGTATTTQTATAGGAGSALAQSLATNTGSADADVRAIATSATGQAKAGALAIQGAVTAGMYAEVDGTGVPLLGFNAVAGTGGIAIPEIPATPNAQDIADVLVSLGLATQAVA